MGHHAPPGRRLSAAAGVQPLEVYPQQTSEPEPVEEGRRLFAQKCRFVAAAATATELAPGSLPEVAFAGRSNVGKSSLVNALTGHRALARTSDTPGRTRQIVFFDLGERLTLVDLPGYGYAQASKALVKSWSGLVRDYLVTRGNLARVCLLLDARHGIKEIDRPLMDVFDKAAVSYQIVLTKADRLGEEDLLRIAKAVAAELRAHHAAHPQIHLTSALKHRGIGALRASLAGLALAAPARSLGAHTRKPVRSTTT